MNTQKIGQFHPVFFLIFLCGTITMTVSPTVAVPESDATDIDSIPNFSWRFSGNHGEAISPPLYQTLTPTSKDRWYDSAYWECGTPWCRVGNVWQHPGKDAPSMRVFHAPRDGEIVITGNVAKLHLAPETDGIRAAILHNDLERWSATVDGGDGTGVSSELKITVKKGDTVRFIVESNGEITCDTTRWDPVVRYTDGPECFTASEMFTDAKPADGESPLWTYETVFSGEWDAPLPVGYATDFGVMIQYEWLREDCLHGGGKEAFLAAAKNHLDRADALLDDLSDSLDEKTDTALSESLHALQSSFATASDRSDLTDREAELLYAQIRGLKRKIAFSNPLTRFGELLFVKRRPTSYSHLVMQYFGWRAQPGGGIFILENPGRTLSCRDLFDGRLKSGSVLEPRLSFDAKKLVFSFVELSDEKFDPKKVHFTDTDRGFYHVWSAELNGDKADHLKQLTDGSFDDITPNWLPDGDIVFSSTRRKGCARCFWWAFGERWQVYTLSRMKPDGSDVKTLSWHDTNEWFPEISPSGNVVYARWDYIDRDAVSHQNLWTTRPDGTNPAALWGNATPNPLCAFQAKPIPGSGKFVFTAAAHHSLTAGSIVVVDPAVGVDGQASLTRITPEVPFPESEGFKLKEFYESPTPLSERYFLVSYSPWPLRWEWETPNRDAGLGIYLLDAAGNRELIYRDPTIGATNPIPLTARTTPPIQASSLPTEADAPDWGEMTVNDVYEGLGDNITRGSIKELRVVQLFPKVTRDADVPPIGMAREENGRAILGTVPVEEDGSAYFRVPARRPFYLQALDENGFAFQTMRSLTYLQPGEKVSCIGCHETRESATRTGLPTAMTRGASILDPGPMGNRPFSYPETIQPILDAKCVACHNAEKKEAGLDLTGRPATNEDALPGGVKPFWRDGDFSVSYVALTGDRDFWGEGTNPQNAAEALVPRFGARNLIQMTEPGGRYGALGSRLMKLLKNGHEGVTLTDEEIRAFATWIDLNAIFTGSGLIEERPDVLSGKRLPMPEIQ